MQDDYPAGQSSEQGGGCKESGIGDSIIPWQHGPWPSHSRETGMVAIRGAALLRADRPDTRRIGTRPKKDAQGSGEVQTPEMGRRMTRHQAGPDGEEAARISPRTRNRSRYSSIHSPGSGGGARSAPLSAGTYRGRAGSFLSRPSLFFSPHGMQTILCRQVVPDLSPATQPFCMSRVSPSYPVMLTSRLN